MYIQIVLGNILPSDGNCPYFMVVMNMQGRMNLFVDGVGLEIRIDIWPAGTFENATLQGMPGLAKTAFPNFFL